MPNSIKRLAAGNRRLWAVNQWVFLIFLAIVCVLGGASRHDSLALIVLRPLSVLAIGYALIVGGIPKGKERVPFLMLSALALLMALQLVPLPPQLWTSFPGRGIVADLERELGLTGVWRPLSLTPGRTLNSLFSLSVPLATFLLFSLQPSELRPRLFWLVIIMGSASMVWGMLQLAGGSDSAFYTYRVHTDDRPIGFFANRNHQAIFIAVTIFFAGILMGRTLRESGRRTALLMTLLGGYIVLALAFEFILGSRGGLLLATIAAASIAVSLVTSRSVAERLKQSRPAASHWFGRLRKPWFIAACATAGLTGLFFVASSLNRNEALARMWVSGDTTRYDRFSMIPYLGKMAADQFPVGSGFGSFDSLFRTYEPRELLSTFYLNQAHNDWMQLVIEGGLIAALILSAFLVWTATQAFRLRKDADGILLLCALCAFAFASVFDYPLRVPILMMVFVLTVCLFANCEPNGKGSNGDAGRGS